MLWTGYCNCDAKNSWNLTFSAFCDPPREKTQFTFSCGCIYVCGLKQIWHNNICIISCYYTWKCCRTNNTQVSNRKQCRSCIENYMNLFWVDVDWLWLVSRQCYIILPLFHNCIIDILCCPGYVYMCLVDWLCFTTHVLFISILCHRNHWSDSSYFW